MKSHITPNRRKYVASARRLMIHLLEDKIEFEELRFENPNGDGMLTFAYAIIPPEVKKKNGSNRHT